MEIQKYSVGVRIFYGNAYYILFIIHTVAADAVASKNRNHSSWWLWYCICLCLTCCICGLHGIGIRMHVMNIAYSHSIFLFICHILLTNHSTNRPILTRYWSSFFVDSNIWSVSMLKFQLTCRDDAILALWTANSNLRIFCPVGRISICWKHLCIRFRRMCYVLPNCDAVGSWSTEPRQKSVPPILPNYGNTSVNIINRKILIS